MKLLSFLLFLFLLPVFLPAQQVEIAAGSGYAACNMSDLKDLNETLMKQLPFESEVVDNFPAWFTYRVSVVNTFEDRVSLGAIYTHSSAGSRVSSADYSGEYHYDTQLTGNSLGLLIGYKVFRYNKLDVRVRTTFGMMVTNASFDEYLQVNGSESSDSYSMSSLSLYLDPEIAVHYRFGLFGAALFGGYRFDLTGHLVLNGQKTNVVSNWSGFNAGAELTISLPFKSEGKADKRIKE